MTVKILKNTTDSNILISDVGAILLANSSTTVDPQYYLLWAASQNVISYIDSGDIVVNDGVNNLTASDGLALVRFPDAAQGVRFAVTSNNFSAKNVQDAIVESRSKAGDVPAIAFSGNPKKATINFVNAFPSADYSVVITGVDKRFWSFESKTTSGFVLNSNANQSITDVVSWNATLNWGGT